MTHTLYFLIGGNQGDRAALLQQATDLIHTRIGSVVSLSAIYQTAPWGTFAPGEEPQDFFNQALQVSTEKSPLEALRLALDIELELGRLPHAQGVYTSRPIDIDMIFYDSLVMNTPELTLPHPRMQLRQFVLKPLCDIAPDYIHPILNQSVNELLQICPDESFCSSCC